MIPRGRHHQEQTRGLPDKSPLLTEPYCPVLYNALFRRNSSRKWASNLVERRAACQQAAVTVRRHRLRQGSSDQAYVKSQLLRRCVRNMKRGEFKRTATKIKNSQLFRSDQISSFQYLCSISVTPKRSARQTTQRDTYHLRPDDRFVRGAILSHLLHHISLPAWFQLRLGPAHTLISRNHHRVSLFAARLAKSEILSTCVSPIQPAISDFLQR